MQSLARVIFGKDERLSKTIKIISFNRVYRFFSRIVFFLLCGLVALVFLFFYRIQIKGRRNLKGIKGAAVSISNHCTYLDPGIIGLALYRRRIHLSGTEKTFKIKGLNQFVRLLGGFPIPAENPGAITPYVRTALKKRDWVHFFAEGDLFDYNQEVMPLMDGAFFYSLVGRVPVIPVSIVLKRRYLFKKEITKPFPKVIVEIGKPIFLEDFRNDGLSSKAIIKKASIFCREEVQALIDKNVGDKTLYTGQIKHIV